jgi:hypothetical protein
MAGPSTISPDGKAGNDGTIAEALEGSVQSGGQI